MTETPDERAHKAISATTETPDWAKGMKKIAAGFYTDPAGRLHINEEEICQAFGVPYTAEASKVIRTAALAGLQKHGRQEIDLEIIDHKAGRKMQARVKFKPPHE